MTDKMPRNAHLWSKQLADLLIKDEMDDNLTRSYLFSVKDNTWEKTLNALKRYGCSKGNQEDEMHDFATEFMLDLIDKDTLRSYLVEGKEVKMSVLTAWFGQFMIRKWQYLGKDASCRALMGAQSQAERKNKKLYTLTSDQVAEISLSGGDESKRNMNVDYFRRDEMTIEDVLHQETVRDCIRKQINDRFGERADFYQSLYETEIDGAFKTRTEWARTWKIPYRDLNKALDELHSAVRELGEDAIL